MKKLAVFIFLTLVSVSLAQKYKDGVYRARASAPIHGWTSVVQVEIKNDEIKDIQIEDYDKDNNERSSDVTDNKNLKKDIGVTYPQIVSNFKSQIMAKKDLNDIDALAGATSFNKTFKNLTKSALKTAEKQESDSIK